MEQKTRDAIIEIAERFVDTVFKAVRIIRERIQKNWEWLKAVAVNWYQLEEVEEEGYILRNRYKRDFTRRQFTHQVMDRRPRCAVRKIIR